MADLGSKDVEKAKLHFDIYDFEGNGKIDAFLLGDLVRSLDLRPTNAAIEKAGGTKRRGERFFTLEEFLPIFSDLKKNTDVGAYEDMVEGLKLYDKHENGLMMSAELAHTLMALGERLENREVEEILKSCVVPTDQDGHFKYEAVGTVKDSMKIDSHYKATRQVTCNLFTPEQRQPCMKYAYEKANNAPLNQFKFEEYRKNGCPQGWHVYSSVLAENKRKAEILEIEQQKPEIITRAAKLPRNTITERAMTPLFLSQHDASSSIGCASSSINDETDSNFTEEAREVLFMLPSPEEMSKAMAETFHGSFVPIDVSGTSFQRMASFRRSLTYGDRKVRTKTVQRRNTICDTDKSVKKSILKRSSRCKSDPFMEKKDESCQTEKNEEEIYKTGKLIAASDRRSSQQLDSGKIECQAQVHREDDKSDGYMSSLSTIKSIGQPLHSSSHGQESTHHPHFLNQNRYHNGDDDDDEKFIKTSANPSTSASNSPATEQTTFLSNLSSNSAVKMRDILPTKGTGDDGRSSSGNWSASSSTHASVDSDHHQSNGPSLDRAISHHSPSGSSIGKDSVISDSLTCSHLQHDASSFPHHEDERAGTANDSNGYVSDTSAISSSYAAIKREELAKLTGETIMASVVVKRNSNSKKEFANRDSESWMKYFEDSSETLTPGDGGGFTSDDSGKTPKVSSPGLGVRSQSSSGSSSVAAGAILNMRQDFHSNHMDDEAESVYSVDTDGYYTSMHTDSGLFRDLKAGVDGNPESMVQSCSFGIDFRSSFSKSRRDSISSVSTLGEAGSKKVFSLHCSPHHQLYRHSHNQNSPGKQQDSSKPKQATSKRLIPLPPIRSTSLIASSTTSEEATFSSRGHSPAMESDSNLPKGSHTYSYQKQDTASESEQSERIRERVKSKTCIGSNDYPSLCNVTSSDASCSAESTANSESTGSLDSKVSKESKKRISSKLLASYKAFRIKDIFKFSTLKKCKVNPKSNDGNKPSLAFNSRDTGHSSSCRTSLSSDSNSPTSSMRLYKSCSVEKNFAISNNTKSSDPYLPRPITDQGFFQTFLKNVDFRNLSDENISYQKVTDQVSSVGQKDLTSNSSSFSTVQSGAIISSGQSNYAASRLANPMPSSHDSALKHRPSTRSSTLILPYKINQRQIQVDIDPSGKILYSSNSLGRRRDDHPMNYMDRIQKKTGDDDKRWLTVPFVIKSRSSSPNVVSSSRPNPEKVAYKEFSECPKSSTPKKPVEQATEPQILVDTNISHKNRQKSESPSDLRPLADEGHLELSPSSNYSRKGPPTFPKPRNNPNRHSFSGITKLERNYHEYVEAVIESLTPKNESIHSPKTPSNDLSTTSTTSTNRSSTPNSFKSKSCSPTTILDLITESRRRLSNKSASNDSTSPVLTSPQSDPGPSLSPPLNNTLLIPGQRRSWSFSRDHTNFMLDNMISNSPGSRRSLAIDRLGPLKPTGMDDFKKLLAATRFSAPSSRGRRISAKELLLSSPKRPLTPVVGRNLNNSLANPTVKLSGPLSSSYSSDIRARVINGRSYRSPYRLDSMYPPIEEDCSEELAKKSIEALHEKSHDSIEQELDNLSNLTFTATHGPDPA